jgi:hypothetical protein
MTSRIRKQLIGVAAAGALLSAGGCAAPETPLETAHAVTGHVTHARGGAPAASLGRELAALRQVTAPFHNFQKAADAGYGVAITPCWEHRTEGGQGYHYGKPDLIGDGQISLLEPELLMFEPQRGGHLRLVGLEYIVFIDDWHQVHGADAPPPTLLGQDFHPHSFLPIYKLHVWLWRNNPSGMFADWNPKVSCDFAEETDLFD